MAGENRIYLEGGEEMKAQLKRYGTDAQQVVIESMAGTGKEMAKDAQSRFQAGVSKGGEFPGIDTGALKKSVVAYVLRPELGRPIAMRLAARGKLAPHAHLLEYGHSKKGGGTVAPRPFLAPTVTKFLGKINSAIQTALNGLDLERGKRTVSYIAGGWD